MNIIVNENSIINQFVAEIRSVDIQKDSLRFRRNLERIGEVQAYEISKKFQYSAEVVQTPLGACQVQLLKNQPVLAVILRAGLPLYQGFLNFFDKAESIFIAAYRDVARDDHQFEIKMDYLSGPSIEGKDVILIDPMLATGKSLLKAYKALLQYGHPNSVNIAAVIASKAGASYIEENIPEATVWVAAMDEELNHKFYIVPGLGDAGDLAFGSKLP